MQCNVNSLLDEVWSINWFVAEMKVRVGKTTRFMSRGSEANLADKRVLQIISLTASFLVQVYYKAEKLPLRHFFGN